MNFILAECFFYCPSDQTGMFLVPQMLQHVNSRVQHRNWIGDVLSGNGSTRVAGTWLENGKLQH